MSEGHVLDPGTKKLYRVLAWASLLTIVAVGLYGMVQYVLGHGSVVGQQLVNVYWPFPPYFAQPITYFSVACVVLIYTGLRLWEPMVTKWPKTLLSFLTLLGFVVAFSSAYEVLYNFMLWGATYSIDCFSNLPLCNPDTLFSNYPVPWNLVFATRLFSALFVASGYSVYYLRRITNSPFI